MKKTKKIRFGAVIMTLSMIVGLLAIPAPVQAASKTTSIYVLKSSASSSGDEGESGSWTSSYKYGYNKNGLVKKCDAKLSVYKYTYKNDRLIKLTDTPSEGYDSLGSEKNTYSYDKKGRIKKMVSVTKDPDTGKTTTTTSTLSYDSKNRITKMMIKAEGEYPLEVSYSYTYNSKGQLAEEVTDDGSVSVSYEYDKKGNLEKSVYFYKYDGGELTTNVTYKNTYDKKGNLVKAAKTYEYSDPSYSPYAETVIYKYRKITVPKKYIKQIKDQQRKMILYNVFTI